MIARFTALFIVALLLFTSPASAQTCNRIIDQRTGQVIKVECFDSHGRIINNGQVFVGGQQFAINNGQFTGCASRFSISIGGRDGRVDFGTCLAEMQNNVSVRTVYTQPNQSVRQQSQAGGDNLTCNNCTVNVGTGSNAGGAGNSPGSFTVKGDNCPSEMKAYNRTQDGLTRRVCIRFVPGSNAVAQEFDEPK